MVEGAGRGMVGWVGWGRGGAARGPPGKTLTWGEGGGALRGDE